MRLGFLPAIALLGLGLVARANAGTAVYLVGLRHVYSIPALPDPHELDRQQIEEDYSAAVEKAQKQYDTDMASIKDEETKDGGNLHQVDRDAVQQNLEQDIADAADKREAALADLYQNCDYVRSSHPEFKVDQDGPYRVVEVETAPTGEYQSVVFYRPYPLYVDVCPYGWVWGTPYPYATFGIQVGLWHSTWISIGCPVFSPMFYDGSVFIVSAPIRRTVIVDRHGWVGGRPPAITEGERQVLAQHYAAQEKSGYFRQGPGGRPLSDFERPRSVEGSAPVSKYSRVRSTGSGTSGSTSSPRPSRYGTTAGSSSGSRYSHTTGASGSTAGSAGRSRYARPSSPDSRSGSSRTRSTGSDSHGGRSGDSGRGGSSPS